MKCFYKLKVISFRDGVYLFLISLALFELVHVSDLDHARSKFGPFKANKKDTTTIDFIVFFIMVRVLKIPPPSYRLSEVPSVIGLRSPQINRPI